MSTTSEERDTRIPYRLGTDIDAVSVYVEGEDRYFDCPCDGVFYRKVVEDGKD